MAAGNPAKEIRPAGLPLARDKSVFLNVPYDPAFEKLFLAYIAAISAYGFNPRATLEIPFGERRPDRILALISRLQHSIHDLSGVQPDRKAPRLSAVPSAN